MKKLTGLLILIVLALLSLCACSDGNLCIPCEDADLNRICDRCGAEMPDQVCVPCIDGNGDAVCDKCQRELLVPSETELVLELTTPPTRAKYYTGDAFDPRGMVITATDSNGEGHKVDGYAIGAPASLDSSVECIYVYYGGSVLSVPIEVSETRLVGVADAKRGTVGSELLIDGYYLGATSDGFLVKDLLDDTILEARGRRLEFDTGDRVRFVSTLRKDEAARLSYLELPLENVEHEVFSEDNEISAHFTSVTGVASWDRMSRSFKESSFKPGVYYKIYADYIYVIKNSDGTLTLHLNDNALSPDSIKPDGTRTVNIVVGTDGAEHISSLLGASSSSLPGKCFSGVIHAVSLGCDADSFDLTVPDDSWVELKAAMTPMHEAIVEVAHAFYNKGSYIHYDQYGTRRNINPSPESATAEERLHLDCSSYVNAVYYEAFGVNVQPYPTTERSPQTGVMTEYAREFYGINPDVIGYFETADYDTDEKKREFIEMVRGTLEIGDVIVYRRASSGHAIIYAGDGYFLHSTGSSYEYAVGDPHSAYDQVDAKGTISKLKLSTYLDDETNSRYILASNVVSIAILRPLARGLEMTEVTEARLTIPGISIEKSASAPHRSAVYSGDAIVYTLSLKNNGNSDVSDIVVTDLLPSGVEYIGGMKGIACNDGTLTYVASLAPGEELGIVYVVKVTSNEPCEIVSAGDVNGVPMNEIINTVSVSLTEDAAKALTELANAFVNDERTFDDPLAMAEALYSELIGMDITECETALALIDSLIDEEGDTFDSESVDAELLVKGLYGGYDIRLGYRTDNCRTRLVREHNLSVGDVIIGEYGDETVVEVYVYLGDGEFLFISTEALTPSVFELQESLTKNMLVSLISFDRYVIIRPSQK